MQALLVVIILISGSVLTGSILLMSPKGGVGFGIGGMSGSNEYGSKKSIESSLKRVALISGSIFVIASLFIPYLMK